MSADAAATVRFGRLEQRGLLLGLSGWQLTLAGTGVVIAILAEFGTGAQGLLLTSPVWLSLLALGVVKLRRRSLVGWIPVVSTWLTRRAVGGTRHLHTPGATPSGLVLPGLARTITVTTSPESGAVLIADRRDATVTAVLAVHGTGFVLDDAAAQERRVAGWSRVLASLGQREDIARVQVLHVQAPSHAVSARRWWADHVLDPDALPARVVAGLLADAEDATGDVECWIAVAVRAPRRRSGADRQVETSLAAVVDALQAADVHVTGWMTRRRLHALLRRTYDPTGVCPHTSGDASGDGGGLLGPMGVEETWSHLRTDTAFHAVYWVSEWPRAEVAPSFLQPLLLAPGASRSFTLLVEPLPTGAALREIRRAKVELAADASQRSRMGRIEDEASRAEADDVLRRERELVAGHGDLRFTGLVTVTADSADGLALACRATEAAAARSMCELRLLVGQQVAAHAAAALPFARSAS